LSCQIDDSDVNPLLAGIYRVSYTALDSSNNLQTYEFYVTFETTSSGELVLTGYYSTANGLTGASLISALRNIITTGFSGKNYDYATTALADTDQDPNNTSRLIEFYTGDSYISTWDGGNTWNREHVWPQSLLGVSAGSSINAASDLHNLKPSNPSINSSRGNKYYDTVLTTVSYYPQRTAIHGDIARMLFYMVIMYDIYSLVDTTPSTYQMGKLSTLLLWHIQDPVDEFEQRRNERIYFHQGNRNPFIDYPELIDYLNIAEA
jgi:endonuclease I